MDINRREFLKLAGLFGAGIIASEAGHKAYNYWNELGNKSDRNILKETAAEILKRKKEYEAEKAGQEIYLGSINDVSRIHNIPAGSSYAAVGSVYSMDSKGQYNVKIPKHVDTLFNEKKSDIHILYLDEGLQDKFFQNNLDTVADFLKSRTEKLGVNVSVNHEVVPYKRGTPIYSDVLSNTEGDDTEELSDKSINLSSAYKYIIITERDNPEIGGEAAYFSNLAQVSMEDWFKKYAGESAEDNPALNALKKVALHEYFHELLGLPHCWEDKCAMSYKPSEFYSYGLGNRCETLAKNILNGELKVTLEKDTLDFPTIGKKDVWSSRVMVKNAKTVGDDAAKQDLINHLEKYLRETTAYSKLENVEIDAELGSRRDDIRFSKEYSGEKQRIGNAQITKYFKGFDAL